MVFTVPEDAGRGTVLDALSGLSDRMPELRVITSFSGKAVVRCGPSEIPEVTATMKESFPECESLITSGTLRKVREVYPELKVPRKRKS